MTSSSRKRVKTLGNKTKDPKRFYSNKFLSNKHERHFNIVQDRRLLMERKVRWIPSLAPQFGEEVERRGWEKTIAYPKPANIAVVKEFYTNARPFGNTHIESYMSYDQAQASGAGAPGASAMEDDDEDDDYEDGEELEEDDDEKEDSD
ncbi:hypothetical protein LR48_Vigan352s000800 [Vigna angularis]|uniref:Uncharacterized protein n=1 Tax=Phaseolus angularis TaxID=3914 RepID=A0A0L9TA74_PHAAN|nr:hypothetical protein LR48_Vigan352s000800 [Vigna angularis]